MNPNLLPAGASFAAEAPIPDGRSSLPPSPFDFNRSATALTASLPKAPTSRRSGGLWDEGNRSQTLLAIGAGLLSGQSLSDGMANASKNLIGLQDRLDDQGRKLQEFGGPDNAFEITTDPKTGQRSVKNVPVFQDYLDRKRVKAKDTADLNGRAMFALSKLPESARPAAYATMRANPAQYGIDPETMPAQYDPQYVTVAGQMGMTVAQGQTRDQSAIDAERLSADRERRAELAEMRAEIARARAEAMTRQGDTRLAQGAERISIARQRAQKAGSGADPRYEYRMTPDGRVQRRLKQ